MIAFFICPALFSLKEVSRIYPMFFSNNSAFTDLICIISLVTLKVKAFFSPRLLIVNSIADPTGPLINSTASLKDLPCTWVSLILTI